MPGYMIAAADEYLAITGAGIRGHVKIAKSAFVFPFQKCQKFSIQPMDYPMSLQAMTKEKLQFLLPVVFTVGPDVNSRGANADTVAQSDANNLVAEAPADRGDALTKYAMLLADSQDKRGKGDNTGNQHIDDIVKGIIEGETRVLVSTLTMEEVFQERDEFKRHILANIATELSQFGLKIYNANIKELRDAPGSNYFASLSKKAHEGAINQARVDVATAQALGSIGEAKKVGEQERELAKIHAETQVSKTERETERAKAEAKLSQNKTNFNREVSIADIEATRATQIRDEELRKDVETQRAATELERLRATDVVKATILRESKEQAALAKKFEQAQAADATQYSERLAADAHAYGTEAQAAASFKAKQQNVQAEKYEQETRATAAFFSVQKAAEAAAYKVEMEANAAIKKAEADLIAQQKHAAGLSAMAGAYSDLSHAFGGPHGLLQYLMIEKGVYQELAKANAEAVRGLNPKMTIWNTGSQAGGEGSSSGMGGMESIRNIYQTLPPLMSTIQEQTGVTLPEWQFGKLGEQLSEREVSGRPIKGIDGK